MSAESTDRFLGGRLTVLQPKDGFRSGLDAVMLAAAVPAGEGEEVLELGSGAGVGALCLATRLAGCTIRGVEISSTLSDLARRNAQANGLDGRLTFVTGDALDPPAEVRRTFDHVFCNPPFHLASGERSPVEGRNAALRDDGRLGEWLAGGMKRVRSHGTLTVIVRADRLAETLAHLPEQGLRIFPLWPRKNEPAKRVIIQVRKGASSPSELLPGLVLHEAGGAYTPEADAILRDAASLALTSRPL